MPTRNMQVELLEEGKFIDFEAEETMLLKTVTTKLKVDGYIASDLEYFIRNFDGSVLHETSEIKSCKANKFILTTNREWKPAFVYSTSLGDAEEVSGELVLHQNTYWRFPFMKDVSWNEFNGSAYLFLLDDLKLSDDARVNFRVLVQASIINSSVVNGTNAAECAGKMRGVLMKVCIKEIPAERIASYNLCDKLDTLSAQMKHYLTMHTEMMWGLSINTIIILGIDLTKTAE